MLPQINLNKPTESLLRKVTSSAECSKDFVSLVAVGHAQQIRHLERAAGLILMELPQVAKMYGGRADIDSEVLKECSKLILEKFGFLSIPEIKEAYRQYSTGEIVVKGAEMYGGEFNASQLGKILGAYSNRRRKVLGMYLREKEEEKEKAAREEKQRIMKAAFDKEFPRMIERAKTEISEWREVPAYWYEAANKRNMIQFNQGEAVAIFEEAQQLAKIEIQAEQEGRVLTLKDVIQNQKKDPIERAKVIARKITVFRKVLGKK